MQPYQQASEEIVRQSKEPGELLKKAGKAAVGVAATAPILSKVAALLNPYVPKDLATKGLEKVNPTFGKFINGATQTGQSQDAILDFIKEKMQETPEEKESSKKPPQQGNIIRQYSDKLHAFIESKIKEGKLPMAAGHIARGHKEFDSIIRKMEKDYKTDWPSILESIYGRGEKAQGQKQQTQQMQQPQQTQSGQGQQALMNILQKIQQSRGGGA
jgi:hypothetical protein